MRRRRSGRRIRITLKDVFDPREGIVGNWIRSAYKKFIVNYFAIYLVSFAFVSIVIIMASYRYYDEEFLKRVLAGAHGLILNMLVLGIVVFWFTRKGQNIAEIERYREEINNLRGLQTKEVSRQLRMLAVMLNKKGVSSIDLSGCHFEDVNFDGFNFKESDFRGSNFDSVTFRDCNIIGANFYSTLMNGVTFVDCGLTRSDFSDSRLEYVNFRTPYLKSISFHNAFLNLVDLSWADLTNASFTSARIEEVDFHNSNLEGAVFLWAKFKHADDLTADQLSKSETLHGAEFAPEFEVTLDSAQLKALYPQLFERPEWLPNRKPRYE